jgi:tetratricopeptide (TPR) repeat protein
MNKDSIPSRTVWLFLLSVLLTVFVYYPGLSGDYMFDDMHNLLDNQRLDIDSLDMDSLQSAAFSSGSGLLRRPVSMLSFSLNRYFFGAEPYSHKVINLIIHLLTGFCLFLLSRRLMLSYRKYHKPHLSDAYIAWLPLVVGGLWLIHPLNLTSVLYIVQRMTSLASLFTVCGLLFYVIGRQRMLDGKPGLPLILGGLVVCGGLAVLSKENGALLPLYMLVVEIALFRFREHSGNLDRSVIAFFTLVVALPAALFLVYLAFNPAFFLGGYNIRDFTLNERLLTEARVLVFYLKLTILPSITDLGLYHDDITLSRSLLDPPSTLYSLVALAGLILGAFLSLKKYPLVGLGILWFFAGHMLESTLLPLEIVHEHRNYLADYGIILAVSSALAEAKFHRLSPVIRKAAPLMFFILFASSTWLRAGQWSDNISHAVYEAIHHPDSFRSVYAAGRIHARLALHYHSDSEKKSYDFLEQASKLSKSDIMPSIVMVKLANLLGSPVKETWFDNIYDSLAFYPINAGDLIALHELSSCMASKCEIPNEKVEKMFRLALENPSLDYSPRMHAQLVTIYAIHSINNRGDFHKGLKLFTRAVELDEKEPQRWINLIHLLAEMQKYDEAEQKLALFKATDTHGGNPGDYKKLQEKIDKQRKEHASMTSGKDSEKG